MHPPPLKTKVIHGFAWNAAEKIASALFQMWVIVKVLNRLSPELTAPISILVLLGSIFNTFVDSGFSQALIRNKDPQAKDFSSAFWFNMAASVVVYCLLVAVSYPTAMLLDMPELPRFAPLLYLVVPLNALSIIQQSVLTRTFQFRRLSTITFAATVASGIIAVAMIFSGFGVWSLVGQKVGLMASRAVMMWIFGKWRPTLQFSGRSIKEMFGYSSRIMTTDLINNIYTAVPQFVIGRIHHGTLGNYDQARKVRDLPVTATMNSMQAVTFPALSTLKDDPEKFKSGVGKVVGSMAFLMFPMMAGLIVVAGDLFGVFIGPQWGGAVPILRILCLAGLASPLSIISGNILRAVSDGRAVVRSEIAKKIIATLILASTIPFGVTAIVWGMTGIAFSDAAVSFVIARRHSNYGFARLAHDTLPTLGLTLAMAAAVWAVGLLFNRFAPDTALWIILAVKILAGAGLYLAGAAIMRLEAFGEFIAVVKKIFGKFNSAASR